MVIFSKKNNFKNHELLKMNINKINIKKIVIKLFRKK